MQHTNYSFYFLLICLAISIVLVYFIAQPFLTPLILAAVFAFLFQPVYLYFLRALKGYRSLAALATTIIIVMLIVVPIFLLGIQIFKETTALYLTIINDNNSLPQIITTTTDKLYAMAPILRDFNINVNQYLGHGLDSITQNFGIIFSNVAKLILDVFVFLMACYFLLKDGEKLEAYLIKINPLKDRDNNLIIARVKAAVLSVVKGSLLVGLIQGVLCGIGFLAFGVPNALLWGSVAVVAALIPGIGTALVTVPVLAFSFFTDTSITTTTGLLLLAIGVGLIDNFIRPKLVGDSIQLHPLAVFIMVIGGLAFFGPVGFILGPLAIVVFIAFIDIYFSQKETNNQSEEG